MTVAGVQERELRVGGIRTLLREAGPGDAREAVVFIHGNPGPSEDWIGLLNRVGGFARAVAWDAPGFGRADKPGDFPQTIDGHAAFIGKALDTLGIDRAHLVMHDFGGPWGLEWAARNPERVSSVVLINTGVLLGYRWHTWARIWQTPVLGELAMATMNQRGFGAFMHKAEPGLRREHINGLYDSYSRQTKRAVLRLYRASRDITGWADATAARLAPLDLPALVVWGAKDAYLPVEQARIQRQVFPSAEIEVLDDSGHWPFLDDAERVEDIVGEFLKRTVPAP